MNVSGDCPSPVTPPTRYPIVLVEFEFTAAEYPRVFGKFAPDTHDDVPKVHFSVDFKRPLSPYPPVICIVLVS